MNRINYFISLKDGRYQANFELDEENGGIQERLIIGAGAEIVYRGKIEIDSGRVGISKRINAIEIYINQANRTGVFDSGLLEKRLGVE